MPRPWTRFESVDIAKFSWLGAHRSRWDILRRTQPHPALANGLRLRLRCGSTTAGQMTDDKVVFSVPWFDVLARNMDGSASPYYVIRTCDYVTVLASTREGALLLVRQFRPAVAGKTLELPSGHVEEGELPEAAARRELAEETGYEAERFELLGTLAPDPGRQGNRLWCFYAPGATQIRSPVVREEGVELVRCEQRDLIRFLKNGEIDHAANLAVVLLATLKGHFSADFAAQSKG